MLEQKTKTDRDISAINFDLASTIPLYTEDEHSTETVAFTHHNQRKQTCGQTTWLKEVL